MTGDADPSHFAGNEFLDSPVALGNGTVFGYRAGIHAGSRPARDI